MSQSYNTVLQVRFGHVDPAGIVYFPRIYDYLHDVFEELWEKHVGQRYYHLLLERKIGFPLVHSEVDFRSPMRFGDRPVVSVTCFKLGRSSLGLRYVFRLADRVCVDARQVTSCVNLERMEPIEIPPQYRERFEDILETT
ncbi:MAG: thioesterase family protein [Planctomycetota bacterium]|nr:thioesterase family protein [Planctomycetota bacterium]